MLTCQSYPIIYERGFVAHTALDDLKHSILMTIRQRIASDGRGLAVFRRQVRSIQNEGIKIGKFCTMERLTTLSFVEFTSTKVANMLVVNKPKIR